jgi:hypothetical protein
MSFALLWRDLRELRWLLIGLSLLAVAGGLVAIREADEGAGRLTAVGWWTAVWAWMIGVPLALRLFYRPHVDGTIRCFDALPVSRSAVFWTRAALGAAVTLSLHAAMVGSAWLDQQAVTAGQAAVVWATTASFQVALWGLAVLAAMLGRLRWLTWFGVLMALVVAVQWAGPGSRWVPLLPLIAEDVTTATAPLAPWLVVEGVAVAAAALVAAWGLAVASGGDVAARLTRPLGSLGWAASVGGVIGVTMAIEQLAPERGEPAALEHAAKVEVDGVVVYVGRGGDDAAYDADALAARVASDVARLVVLVDAQTPPPVLVVPRRDVDPGATLTVKLGERVGVALAPSYRDAADGGETLLRWEIARAVLDQALEQREVSEAARWWLDGAAGWASVGPGEAAQVRLRAAALAGPVTAAELAAWDTTSERLGRCGASALAFVATEALVALVGEDGLAWAAPRVVPAGGRTWRLASPDAVLRDLGVSLDDVATVLRATLAAVAEAEAGRLGARAPWAVTWSAAPLAGRQRGLALAIGPSAPLRGWWAVVQLITPYQGELSKPIDRVDGLGLTLSVPGVFVAGDEVALLAEADDPVLGCPARLGPGRVVLP